MLEGTGALTCGSRETTQHMISCDIFEVIEPVDAPAYIRWKDITREEMIVIATLQTVAVYHSFHCVNFCINDN